MDKTAKRESGKMKTGGRNYVAVVVAPQQYAATTRSDSRSKNSLRRRSDLNYERSGKNGLRGRPSDLLREEQDRSDWYNTFLAQARIWSFASELPQEMICRLRRIPTTREPTQHESKLDHEHDLLSFLYLKAKQRK